MRCDVCSREDEYHAVSSVHSWEEKMFQRITTTAHIYLYLIARSPVTSNNRFSSPVNQDWTRQRIGGSYLGYKITFWGELTRFIAGSPACSFKLGRLVGSNSASSANQRPTPCLSTGP